MGLFVFVRFGEVWFSVAKFIDEAIIEVISGNGGSGAVSFWREKYVPKGGPDGGDGGKGGSVYAVAAPNLSSLMDLRYKRKYSANNGKGGGGGNKTGADGDDIFVPLPIGSILTDADSGETIAEIADEKSRILLAQGGRGGKGNTHFKSSTHQAPRFAQPGEEGSRRRLKVELKLLADVGLVGYPNAGKSTLISKISAARPKIADYPFTTLVPNLGVVKVGNDINAPHFVVADVPGLIEGASLGRGLGHRFLKHLERTHLLVHLMDGAKLLKEFGAEDPTAIVEGAIRDKEIIDAELYTFNPELSEKPRLFSFNKADLFTEEFLSKIEAQFSKKGFDKVYFISGATHTGLDKLVGDIAENLAHMKALKNSQNTRPSLPNEIESKGD